MTATAPPDDDFASVLAIQMEELTATSLSSAADRALIQSLLESDLQNQLQLLSDHAFAESMYRATVLDGELIQEEVDRQLQIQADREFAEQLSNSVEENLEPEPKRRRRLDPAVEVVYQSYLATLSAVCWKDRGRGEGTSAVQLVQPNATRLADCSVCGETKEDYSMVLFGCSHVHCLDCLRLNFLHAMRLDPFQLPRCCQAFPICYAAEVLHEQELNAFHRLLSSLNSGRQINCSNVRCNTILRPEWIKHEIGLCLTCETQTCTICLRASHNGDCPADESTTQLFQIAQTNRWQRCFHCGAMVQLHTGCYHITCRCGKHFCYICGAEWKSCSCEHFEEDALRGGQPRTVGSLLQRNPVNVTRQLGIVEQEIRAQAQQHEAERQTQLAALQYLRTERASDREVAIMEKTIREEESRMKELYIAEQREAQRKLDEKLFRRARIRLAIEEKLRVIMERATTRGKGKGKARAADGGEEEFRKIARTIVDYVVAFEDMPPKPPPSKRKKNHKKRRNNPKVKKQQASTIPDSLVGTLRLVGINDDMM